MDVVLVNVSSIWKYWPKHNETHMGHINNLCVSESHHDKKKNVVRIASFNNKSHYNYNMEILVGHFTHVE
jgi:hypothetical protein